jgi:hypothetical protein
MAYNTAMSEPLPTLLTTLLNSELIHWFAAELLQLWREHCFSSTYKVEAHHATLELMDQHGSTTIYTKRQLVTFLQNDIFAIQDQAWGDGEIFTGYQCSPGVIVDKYIESNRWKILISLRGTKNKGDTEEFIIERTIKQGFIHSTEHFQTQIDHPTKQLTLSIIFPTSRLPKSVMLLEQHSKRSTLLGKEAVIPLSHGRIEYQWNVAKPRLFEAYILKWEW